MRTLKKTLSLVLVVAMVLGLCVVGASAKNAVDDYKDADKIGDAYYEAVGVMTGIGVIKGMGDGILSPTGNYTRAQAAKIITYMLIGEKAAESLVCTTAPFEDVAANHWAAGYIAFCVEQGIINGMSATTFEPEGQLTGFQWAKMLLCAVGFGSKGEFTGNSWSLNTAKVAHNVGVFTGDLAGADHVALQRQQAILYAFNVLTNVGCVVYSESLGDYIYSYNNFIFDRYTYEGTLGWNIYKLKSVTGVIVNNEGMGNATTNVNVKGEYTDYAPNTVSVKADTGLDMMYHAARIWYVEGTKANTGVFVYDLAKTETTKCPAKATDGALKIGDTTKSLYEAVAVDNTAIDAGKKTVEFYASWEVVGAISTVNKTTVLGSYGAVKNEYITSDADVESNDWVIVLKAGEKAYYTYALSATSGAVQSVDKKGNITLTDGTVLAPSNIAITGRAAEYAELLRILAITAHITPTYYFTLDTHGHYMYLTQTPFQTVAYFTGVTKLSSAHDAWSNSVQFAAQFVDVQTGEIETIPVRNDWVNRFTDYSLTTTRDGQGYFDITDELYGDPTYSPHPVLGTAGAAATYSDKFVNIRDYTFRTTDTTCTLGTLDGRNIRFNPSTVTFIIANGAGDSLTVDTYTGVSGLIAGYAEKHNQKVTSVTLLNMAVTYSKPDAGNPDAVVIFAYDSTIANGQYVFFPYDVTSWDVIADNYYGYDVAYLDGKEAASDMVFTRDYYLANLTGGILRGFYTYTINELGFYTISRVANENQKFIYQASDIDEASGIYWINGHRVADDVVIADTRANVPDELKVRNVANLYDLIYETNWANPDVQIAYMIEGTSVGVIYVVDWNLGVANITIDNTVAGWKFSDGNKTGRFEDGTVRLYNDGLAALDEGTVVTFEGVYYLNWNAYDVEDFIATGKVVKPTSDDPYVAVTVDDLTKGERGYYVANITIDEAYYVVKVDNKQTEFSVNYKCGDMASSAAYPTTGIEMPVGGALDLAFLRGTVAAGIASKVAYVNNTTAATAEVNSIAGQIWINFIPKGNTVTINSITAELTLSLGNKDNYPAMLFNFYFDGCDAEDDTLKTTFVPGSALPLRVQRSGSEITGQDGSQLQFTTTKSGTITSVTTVDPAKDTSNMVFVFEDYVPKANSDLISGMKWVGEVKP